MARLSELSRTTFPLTCSHRKLLTKDISSVTRPHDHMATRPHEPQLEHSWHNKYIALCSTLCPVSALFLFPTLLYLLFLPNRLYSLLSRLPSRGVNALRP